MGKAKNKAVKAYVKLKDSGSIFYDAHTNTELTGKKVVEVTLNGRLRKAIKGGALIKVEKAEYTKYVDSLTTKDDAPAGKVVEITKSAYAEWKSPELKAEADKRGITYKSNVSNKDLKAELETYDADPEAYEAKIQQAKDDAAQLLAEQEQAAKDAATDTTDGDTANADAATDTTDANKPAEQAGDNK